MLALLAAVVTHQHASCCDPMAVFASDPDFVASHLAPEPFAFAPLTGKTVTIPISGEAKASGYFIPSKDSSVAIVMVHEWWGLNDHIKKEAEDLASETGYGVLALDMYDGKLATDAKEAGKLMGGVNVERCGKIVKSAVHGLKVGGFGKRYSKLGSIGWCFGGGWSFQTAFQSPGSVQACVIYYGMPETDASKLKGYKTPTLMIWGKKDKWINAGVVTSFTKAMTANKVWLKTLAYDDDHAFANPRNPKYDSKASADAHANVLRFYSKYLGK